VTLEISARLLHFVNVLHVSLDLARAHAARVHGDDLVVEAGEARLALTDDLRLVPAVSIPRRLQRDLAEDRQDLSHKNGHSHVLVVDILRTHLILQQQLPVTKPRSRT
jgi:hypothetical protein